MSTRAKSITEPLQKNSIASEKSAHASRRINIFISYASEDGELVSKVVDVLKDTFEYAPLELIRDVERIKEGENYAKEIDTLLDEADILLIVFTERMKVSHSYTGYEVGYFNKSIQQKPRSPLGFDRIYIPVCIGADIPDTIHYIQSISINKKDVYKVLETKMVAGSGPAVDKNHPFFNLLNRLHELVMTITNTSESYNTRKSRDQRLEQSASLLYKIVHEYLQSRVSSAIYPERKLRIRMPTTPELAKHGSDFAGATVQLIGDFFELFNIPMTESIDREYRWSEFVDKVPTELRTNCVAGIQKLASTVPIGSGDNYHVVSNIKHDKSFRLFVSQIVTYVSQKTDIDIYVVQMVRKDYGDRQTTRLLKAISVGLRFRFLVLEEDSEFRPERLGHPIISLPVLKEKTSELLGQIELVLADSIDADLYSPDMSVLIWGPTEEDQEKVQEMMDAWKKVKDDLYAAADGILNALDDESVKLKKKRFIEALKAFTKEVDVMNREFTTRVLRLLKGLVERKLSLPQIAPSPPPRN